MTQLERARWLAANPATYAQLERAVRGLAANPTTYAARWIVFGVELRLGGHHGHPSPGSKRSVPASP